MKQKNAHCSYCGLEFPSTDPWPRTCAGCQQISYLNPLPVAVVVLPVGDNGVLVIRRDIEPGRGQLALPGGFIDIYESWQEAAARELWEEACIKVDPSQIQEYRVRSNTPPDGYLMVFGLGPRLALEELPPFVPNSETTERLVITEMVPLCFLTHEKVLREYFAGR